MTNPKWRMLRAHTVKDTDIMLSQLEYKREQGFVVPSLHIGVRKDRGAWITTTFTDADKAWQFYESACIEAAKVAHETA